MALSKQRRKVRKEAPRLVQVILGARLTRRTSLTIWRSGSKPSTTSATRSRKFRFWRWIDAVLTLGTAARPTSSPTRARFHPLCDGLTIRAR